MRMLVMPRRNYVCKCMHLFYAYFGIPVGVVCSCLQNCCYNLDTWCACDTFVTVLVKTNLRYFPS